MNIFDFILEKLNDEKDVFVGNFVFQFHHNGFTMNKIDEEYLSVETIEYVPVAEMASQETPYVEANNKSDFTKVYGMMLKIPKGEVFDESDEAYQAMLALKTEINGKVFTIDGRKVAFKVTVPQFRANIPYAGHWWVLFEIQVTFTVMDEGYFGNEYTVKIRKKDTGSYHTLDVLMLHVPMGKTEIAKNPVGTKANTTHSVHSRTVMFTLSAVYHGVGVEKDLYLEQWGKGDRDQLYDLQIQRPDGEANLDFVVKVLRGSPEIARGSVQKLAMEMGEA